MPSVWNAARLKPAANPDLTWDFNLKPAPENRGGFSIPIGVWPPEPISSPVQLFKTVA